MIKNENGPLDILVCNDDGITAGGIHCLIQAVKPFGKITVVAPDSPQSGMGHAISVGKPLRLAKFHIENGIEGYACNGTPVDCVKLATAIVLKHKPHLLVSGVNHGSNASISVLYSGTMSAAVEGAIEGIPSIGFSLSNFNPDADFSACTAIIQKIVKQVIRYGLSPHTALNVNIPDAKAEDIKGIKIARQAQGRFVEEFDERIDPYGRHYYWLSGNFKLEEHGQDTDIWALNNQYVSIVPVQIDVTAYHSIPELNQWEL